MADVQDEDQWLYGDEKESKKDEENDQPSNENENLESTSDPSEKKNENEKDSQESTNTEVNENEKDKQDEEEKDTSSSDDEDDDLTVTIGEVKKQADIVQPAHQARFQPKAAPTSGLKDEDFSAVGKVNGTPITEFDISEFEDKPWRKPGADLSDYFNYGFNEDTWLKYCEKQRIMRMNESKVGLTGLGVNVSKPINKLSSQANITIVNENSKYCGGQRKMLPTLRTSNKPEGNTIQVMTADRRTYSSKVTNNYNNDSLEYGGDSYNNTPYYSTGNPPPNFYTNPPPNQYGNNNWGNNINTAKNNTWIPENPLHSGPPPGFGAMNNPPPNSTYEEERARRGSPDDDRHKSRRTHHSRRSRSPTRHRRRSRSRSRSRSKSRSRSRSKSRSPSHRHKRKKSKRDRDVD